MGYFILAPVLLADYKSAIVTYTAADCKSAETEIRNSYLYSGGLQIRRNW